MSQFKFCPRCATALIEQERFGAMRQICPNCDFVLFQDPKVVTVVLVEHEGKILLGKRNVDPAKGLWSFLGGYVDRGEIVESAAVREVKEETNLEVSLTGLIGVYSQQDSPVVLIAYKAEISGELSQMFAQPEEVAELVFFGLDEMPELAFPFDTRILHDWAVAPFLPLK